MLDALTHQDMPFEQLVADWLARDLARNPLFQTMCILHTQDDGHPGEEFADAARVELRRRATARPSST